MPEFQAAERWFAGAGREPFAFQREVWQAMAAGRSGLLHASTGAGKTYAVWLGALLRAAAGDAAPAPGLRVLWLTPMRALAADTARALALPLPALAPRWRVALRTGDTPSAERARQERHPPQALVTTPESLTLMLTRASAREDFAGVDTVIVDEWHELMGNKRGVQVQLALARLARWRPALVVWGLSATLANLDDALGALLGPQRAAQAMLVRGRVEKELVVDTLIPPEPGRFSWAGHLGAQMLQPVVREIDGAATALVFTNTRSQAEAWYQLILQARPDWAGVVALHHGSLAREVRDWVETGLKQGRLKAVVATSSLDLGVDFLPVERVLQIGSAKGIARLLQRGGRSGHAPGRRSRITLVPTNTLELVEAVAARRAAQAGRIEPRNAPDKPLDVLVQHLVSIALGGGFRADDLFEEVRTTQAYRTLARAEFDWALAFVEKGGRSLAAYPEYRRVKRERGVFRVPDAAVARRHRHQVGTIVSEAGVQVAYLSGGRIGVVEESFIARLRPGDCFVFAGRVLELVRTREMTAYVNKADRARAAIPVWSGGRMPLSSELADATLALFGAAAHGEPGLFDEPEMRAARPMLDAQARLSRLPTPGTLLVERHASAEGHHVMLYPFAGRNVHLGLASLLAWRLARGAPNTFSLSVNDLGLELLSALPVDLSPLLEQRALSPTRLLPDLLASLNASELAQRRFREIARVAGLVTTGYPGATRSARQLQASSALFFEVFRQHDAGNRLLAQAEREALAQELELPLLAATCRRLQRLPVECVTLEVPSPLALPLMVERFRERLTTERLGARLQRMLARLEAAADGANPPSATVRRRQRFQAGPSTP